MVTDVFVAGGGPAGLAAAIAARMKGLQVIVADGGRPPIDKACGEGLMPDSLRALDRLGVRLTSEHGYSFRGIRFLGHGAKVDASFPQGCGMGIRRTVLHGALIERASVLGVKLLWGKRVTGIRDGTAELDGLAIHSKLIIGADGQASPVRRWAGLEPTRRESKRFGFRRHYRLAPWTDCVEVHWARNCQIYVTPVAADEVGLAIVSRDAHLRLSAALAAFPSLARRMYAAPFSSAERGAVSFTRTLRHVSKGKVALIGDASGSVDAITGEGLGLAFQQALSLADAFANGRLELYEQAHRTIGRRPARIGTLLLLMDRFPLLQGPVLGVLDSRTHLFEKMLAFHVGGVKGKWTHAETW